MQHNTTEQLFSHCGTVDNSGLTEWRTSLLGSVWQCHWGHMAAPSRPPWQGTEYKPWRLQGPWAAHGLASQFQLRLAAMLSMPQYQHQRWRAVVIPGCFHWASAAALWCLSPASTA